MLITHNFGISRQISFEIIVTCEELALHVSGKAVNKCCVPSTSGNVGVVGGLFSPTYVIVRISLTRGRLLVFFCLPIQKVPAPVDVAHAASIRQT